MSDVAEQPLLDDAPPGLFQMGRGPALQADLDDAVVLACRGQHGLAFQDVDADRLLAVDVDAGPAGGDHGERVPVVGRRDQHEVQLLLLQHFPVVEVRAGRLA